MVSVIGTVTKKLRPRGFWRRDAQVSILCRVIAGDLTAAQAARKLNCTPVMIRQQTYKFRKDLKVAYAAGRLAPGVTLALLGLTGEANRIMDAVEENRKRNRSSGGDRAYAAQTPMKSNGTKSGTRTS